MQKSCLSECGSVSGAVVETVGSSPVPVPGVKVVFVDKNFVSYEVKTNAAGTYELRLAYGTYWMQVLKDGTCAVQRPDFRISPGEELHFDFVMVLCASDSASADYHEQTILGDRSSGRPDIRIGFGEHISTGTVDVYKGFLPQNSQVPFLVTVAADRYTIRAKKVTFYKPLGTFVAEGAVEVFDGHESKRGTAATVSFRDGLTPTIEIER